MKRQFLFGFIVLILVCSVLTGCGKSSKPNGNSDTNGEEYIITQERTGQIGVFEEVKEIGGNQYVLISENGTSRMFLYEAKLKNVIGKLQSGEQVQFAYYKDKNNQYVLSYLSK